MAVSGTRRGPGWWMDRNGDWKPPELWPETTPPLPGWVRDDNGRWVAPADVGSEPVAETTIDLTKPTPEQPTSVRTPRHAAEVDPVAPEHLDPTATDAEEEESRPTLSLSYAEPAATIQPAHAAMEPAGQRGLLIAAGIAAFIALLVVVMLVL